MARTCSARQGRDLPGNWGGQIEAGAGGAVQTSTWLVSVTPVIATKSSGWHFADVPKIVFLGLLDAV